MAQEELILELRAVIEQARRRLGGAEMKTEGEIFPGDIAPVIANSRAMCATAFPMRWGFPMNGGRRIINARSETAAEKPMFAESMRCRRCLIPMSGYYEWEKRPEGSAKYAIQPEDPAGAFLAGVYRVQEDRGVFVILTREPAENIAFIHDRMPVLIPRSAAGEWLDPVVPAREALARAMTRVVFQRT